ncbi:hypothetical protein B0H17DRAFT_1130092 [Mycena rosella]|uniref:Uncharacterized protein n=1 Tax=Mycena rosella TaxID=1033263 RepID=A0AAD7DRQ3_MYCRO|nr:hypothetical protein B0H17DRAFT_1130092 [Mycena rosella]
MPETAPEGSGSMSQPCSRQTTAVQTSRASRRCSLNQAVLYNESSWRVFNSNQLVSITVNKWLEHRHGSAALDAECGLHVTQHYKRKKKKKVHKYEFARPCHGHHPQVKKGVKTDPPGQFRKFAPVGEKDEKGTNLGASEDDPDNSETSSSEGAGGTPEPGPELTLPKIEGNRKMPETGVVQVNFYDEIDRAAPPCQVLVDEFPDGSRKFTTFLSQLIPAAMKNNSPIKERGGRLYRPNIRSSPGHHHLGKIEALLAGESSALSARLWSLGRTNRWGDTEVDGARRWEKSREWYNFVRGPGRTICGRMRPPGNTSTANFQGASMNEAVVVPSGDTDQPGGDFSGTLNNCDRIWVVLVDSARSKEGEGERWSEDESNVRAKVMGEANIDPTDPRVSIQNRRALSATWNLRERQLRTEENLDNHEERSGTKWGSISDFMYTRRSGLRKRRDEPENTKRKQSKMGRQVGPQKSAKRSAAAGMGIFGPDGQLSITDLSDSPLLLPFKFEKHRSFESVWELEMPGIWEAGSVIGGIVMLQAPLSLLRHSVLLGGTAASEMRVLSGLKGQWVHPDLYARTDIFCWPM